MKFGTHTVGIPRPDKVLFPGQGLTEHDLCSYYAEVAPWMTPHLRDRPLSLQRFPDGIGEPGLYQKNAADWFPAWIRTVEIPKKEGGANRQVVAGNAATLAYLASQATISLHVCTSRADALDGPDRLVFDLDPADDDFAAAIGARSWTVASVLDRLRDEGDPWSGFGRHAHSLRSVGKHLESRGHLEAGAEATGGAPT